MDFLQLTIFRTLLNYRITLWLVVFSLLTSIVSKVLKHLRGSADAICVSVSAINVEDDIPVISSHMLLTRYNIEAQFSV